MVNTIKLGEIVRVVFWDHATGDGEHDGIVECVAYGKIIEVSEDEVKICPWETGNFEDGMKNEYYCLVRSAIETVEVLEVRSAGKE